MHAARRLLWSCSVSAIVLLTGATTAVSTAGQAAPPHQDHAAPSHQGHVHDYQEHLAEDLVGTPIRVIEQQTARNAERIRRQTGVRPGTAPGTAAVAARPALSGSWSSVVPTPVVPVFAAVLPNGKMLIWDSVGDNAAETYPDHDFTRAMVWNPTTDTSKRVDLKGSNIFCAGFAHLANGNILVAGGNANAHLDGTVRTYVFHWQTETWTRGKDMAAARWYPAVAEMANGEETIVGGGPKMAEVYQVDGAIRPLANFTAYDERMYPFMGSRPDTQLGLFGPYATTYVLNTSGNGTVRGTGKRDDIYRDYGSYATYDIGKSLVTGGSDITEDGVDKTPTRTAVVVDNTTGLVATAAPTASMSTGRRHLNATVLADGSVLATGGLTNAARSDQVDLDHAATTAERWDPATGTWTVLASAHRIRQYHSTATLLPDGRVMTGGGGICAKCMEVGYLEKNIEYFSPPYLYNSSGAPASRPAMTAPSTIKINTKFTVKSGAAARISKVTLVGLGDVTHAVNQGQRYVPLAFSRSGTTLTVTGPPNGGVAPPGYYMLFIVDEAGVPSVAAMVKVAQGPRPLMSAVRTSAGRCVEVPAAATKIRTYLRVSTCTGGKAQALTRLPDDNTLRVLGNCVDVPGRKFAAGQPIWAYTCNRTVAQVWQFRTDHTIRPRQATALCLAAASATNRAAVALATCNGNALQKWTW